MSEKSKMSTQGHKTSQITHLVYRDYWRSRSFNAGTSWGKRNWKPAASAAAGTTRWLASRTCDISPNNALRANSGTGKIAGLCNAWASARVNSELIAGEGATPLSAPLTGRFKANWNNA